MAARQVTEWPPEITIAISASSSRYSLHEVRVLPAEDPRELVGLLPDDRDRVLHRPGPLQLQRRPLGRVDLRAV